MAHTSRGDRPCRSPLRSHLAQLQPDLRDLCDFRDLRDFLDFPERPEPPFPPHGSQHPDSLLMIPFSFW